MNFSIISAIDLNRGIGFQNRLPWHLPPDMKHFKEETMGGTVIMGRKTWESIPEKFRPFTGRLNIVISRGEQTLPEGVLLAHSFEEALELAEAYSQAEEGVLRKAFVIGGASLYAEAIQNPACNELILTHIQKSFEVDSYFPSYDEFEALSLGPVLEYHQDEQTVLHYRFAKYIRKTDFS